MKSNVIRSLVIVSLLSTASVCSAATTTGTMSVSTTVNSLCILNSASAITFAAFDPSVNSAQTSTGTISVNCTNTTPFNIGLSAGSSSGATVSSRAMVSGSNSLSYQLYSDSGRSTIWGDVVGTNTVSGTGAGLAAGNVINKTVYASIPLQANAAPGSYSDTVTVTVTY